MTIPDAIAQLPSRRTELAELLVRWANINSGSGHSEGLARLAAELRTVFSAAFPAATCEELTADDTRHNPPGAKALRYRLRPDAPVRIFCCGHYDTVFAADDAFQSCRWLGADTLNGPGVTDMKGGLVVLLAALQAFEQTPHAAKIGWEVLLTPDEETGSHGTRTLLEEAARRHHFGLVFEPARPNGNIIRSRSGTGGAVATCHGRSGHAAKVPSDGRNAIVGLSDFLLAAAKLPAELPGVLINVANFRGGGAATNVVPDLARAELDLRITRATDRTVLFNRLEELARAASAAHEVEIELRLWLNRPPKETHPLEERLFPGFLRAASDVGLRPFSWEHGGGASDGNFLGAAGLPCFDGIGPEGDGLHSPREICRVDTLAPRAANVALFLHRLASGELALNP